MRPPTADGTELYSAGLDNGQFSLYVASAGRFISGSFAGRLARESFNAVCGP